jgi:hypothetical protein
MPTTRLILVEGIPGAGKTTTAQFVCDWLTHHGREPALFLEGDWDHPADYESVACLDEGEYAALRAAHPAQADLLARYARHSRGEWFFSYRRMAQELGDALPAALLAALARYEIYDLPAERHCRLLLQSWRDFAARAAGEERVYVFECCFLQNPITTLLARHNLPLEAVRAHVRALAEIVAPLQPRLTYLAQTDVRATLEGIRRERSPEWADYVAEYLTGQEYGRAHGLSGFDGVIAFYAMRQTFELELLKALPLASAVVADDTDWEARYRALEAFLEE